MITVYTIHGYGAAPGAHWFPALQRDLETDNITVCPIALPEPNNPNLESWIDTLRKEIKSSDQTYIVAHSLGVITALRFLQTTPVRVDGIVMVAGFAKPLENLPQLTPFVRNIPELKELTSRIPHKHMFYSDDDYIVPAKFSRELAAELGADITVKENAGHFLSDDGVTHLPEVYTTLHEWYADMR